LLIAATLVTGCSSSATSAKTPPPQHQWSEARAQLLTANSGRFRSSLVEHECKVPAANGCDPLDVHVSERGSFSIRPAAIDYLHVVTRPDSGQFRMSLRGFADGSGFLHYEDGSMGPCWSAVPLSMLFQSDGPPTPLGIKVMLAAQPVEGGLGLTDGVLRARAPAPQVMKAMGVMPPVADKFEGSTVPIDLHVSSNGKPTGFAARGVRVGAAIAHTEAGKGNLEAMTVASNDLVFELDDLGVPQHFSEPDGALINHSGLHDCRANHH
jgi:hypothetical protein